MPFNAALRKPLTPTKKLEYTKSFCYHSILISTKSHEHDTSKLPPFTVKASLNCSLQDEVPTITAKLAFLISRSTVFCNKQLILKDM